jgi:hypothetical protein
MLSGKEALLRRTKETTSTEEEKVQPEDIPKQRGKAVMLVMQ